MSMHLFCNEAAVSRFGRGIIKSKILPTQGSLAQAMTGIQTNWPPMNWHTPNGQDRSITSVSGSLSPSSTAFTPLQERHSLPSNARETYTNTDTGPVHLVHENKSYARRKVPPRWCEREYHWKMECSAGQLLEDQKSDGCTALPLAAEFRISIKPSCEALNQDFQRSVLLPDPRANGSPGDQTSNSWRLSTSKAERQQLPCCTDFVGIQPASTNPPTWDVAARSCRPAGKTEILEMVHPDD